MTPTASAEESRARVIIQAHDPRTRETLRKAALGVDGEVTLDLPIIDAFATSLPPSALESLRASAVGLDGEVAFIPDTVVKLDEPISAADAPSLAAGKLNASVQAVHAQSVWKAGYRGAGVGIAVIDTGIAPHPDFGDRIVAFQDLVNGQSEPYDDRGHGTHVAGIAAGNGAASNGCYAGAAPEASLVGIKVMDSQGSGQLSTIIAGVQWAVDNKAQYNIRVINMSLGSKPAGPVSKDPLVQATKAANDAGILVVAAAGNKGPYPQTIDTPAAAPNVLAVGGTVDYSTPDIVDDKVAWYSSTGPTLYDHLIKPDVVAPGTQIACPDPNGRYVYDTGTSMASPLVAGVAALMSQAAPNLSPTQLRNAIVGGATRIRQYEANIQGKGVVQADRSLVIAQHTPVPPTPSPAPPPTPPPAPAA